jgi:hypothetical protein
MNTNHSWPIRSTPLSNKQLKLVKAVKLSNNIKKGLQKWQLALLLITAGMLWFYNTPSNLPVISIVITPLLLFLIFFGRLFKDIIISQPDSAAPLLILGMIYGGMCWFIVSQPIP